MHLRSFVLLGLLSIATVGISQNYAINQGGVVNACGGTFTDDGVGSAYSDNPYTITFCPDVPGDVVQVAFAAFSLQVSPGNGNSDQLYVYDGVNAQAPSLGNYGGNQTNLQITATVNNTTGCLTFVFDPNGPANAGSPGWEGIISCTTPCNNPVMNSTITNPLPTGPNQSVSICAGASVSFSGTGSFAQPGFNLVEYAWDFADGTQGQGINQTHTFTEPGEYVVSLTVKDNNGCTNLNVIPLQVLVSTTPFFPGVAQIETDYCFGDDIVLDAGQILSPTWTALPPQVVSGLTYLADGAGFSYSTSIVYDFFEPGATLTSCSDLLGILVNMEHSYMGDLGIFVTCPNGTSVNLVEWGTNGGGGTFLGQATDDNNINNLIPGVGYDYIWSPTATNGTWGQNAGNNAPQLTYVNTLGQNVTNAVLPSGTYQAAGNLCNLVGCPLNGSWTFSVTDNLGADNGYIFYWGLNLNPALFPGITTFTPTYGQSADSTYWQGPFIQSSSSNANIITLNVPGPGSYDYTFYATNNFGCTFDTTITINVTQAPFITAGPDLIYSCGDLPLQGGFLNQPSPSCQSAAGNYTMCYVNNVNNFQTYCPDNANGATAMRITISAGSTENFWDEFYVYDGPNTSSPLLAGPLYGNLAGLTFTATNPSGCLTIGVTPDGSVDCGGGSQTPIQYQIDCTPLGPQYTWQWSPATALSSTSVPQPLVQNLTQNTTYTLVGYPVGHPGCSSTDQVTVNIDPIGNPGNNTQISICSTDAPFPLLSVLQGNPVNTGSWTGPTGAAVPSGTYNPLTDQPGNYTYSVTYGNCTANAILTISMALPTQILTPNDTTICYNGDINLNLYNLSFGQAPFSYNWTYNGTTVSTQANYTHSEQSSGLACLTVTDACQYEVTNCFFVTVQPEIDVQFEADTTRVCFPESFKLTNLVDPAAYSQSLWTISNGQTITNQSSFTQTFAQPGTYDVTLTLTSDIGCSYTASKPGYLISHPTPIAGFDPDPQPTNSLNTTITFEDQSIGSIAQYLWTFGTSPVLGTSNLSNPVFEFPIGVGGEYPVKLEVTDVNNCKDFVIGIVDIDDIFQVFVPTGFTPNGDGINDVLFVQGSDIDPNRFLFQVFNRWGDLIFETRDPATPWVGDVNEGDFYAGNGVYLWRAVVTSASTGEKKELSGHISIFR